MGETKQVVGTLDGITEKSSGWFELAIVVPGKQYPVKLATKRQEVIDEARKVSGGIATWTYTETESDRINEHTNKPYINRYLEVVEAGASAEAVTASGKDDVDWDAKERRDYRSRAWAQTLSAFTHTIKTDEPAGEVFDRLKPFQRAIYEDVCQSFAYPVDDDDVPF